MKHREVRQNSLANLENTKLYNEAHKRINFMPRNLAIIAINFYQAQISSYKGFKCAYAKLHKDSSCSQYGKDMIERHGVLGGLTFLWRRLKTCRQSAYQLQAIAYLFLLSSCSQIDTRSWNIPILCNDDTCACSESFGEACGKGCGAACFG